MYCILYVHILGLSESIVAAAASRIGKTVLHLDTNEYYGGFWASFDLKSLINYAEQEKQDNVRPFSFIPWSLIMHC